MSLRVAIPELGYLNRRQIAALVGLAPYNCDSGRFRGQRRSWGGRAFARRILYMVALAAIRHDPQSRELFLRLKAAGKPGKVALVAVMRKYIIRLNAIVRDERATLA